MSYTDEVAVMQDGTELRPRGQYDDECVKVSGEWKFSRRVLPSCTANRPVQGG